MSYEIRRFYADPDKDYEVILDGLTLEEAQEHCKSPETSSTTTKTREGLYRTRKFGAWFDGFTEVDDD